MQMVVRKHDNQLALVQSLGLKISNDARRHGLGGNNNVRLKAPDYSKHVFGFEAGKKPPQRENQEHQGAGIV